MNYSLVISTSLDFLKMEYKTISPAEVHRWEKIKTKELLYRWRIHTAQLEGRKADIEFFTLQSSITQYVLDEKLIARIRAEILFWGERIDLINKELKKRGINPELNLIN